MGRPRIRASCEAFEVTLDEPRPGDHELRIEVVFAPDGPTDSATIELRLYSRRLGWVIREEMKWDREASVPGTAARLERGASGRLSFTRPLPAFVTGHKGTGLEIAPVLVTEGTDGSRLRTALPLPQVGPDTQLVVRGLPRTEPLTPSGLLPKLRRGAVTVDLDQPQRGVLAVALEDVGSVESGRVRLEAVEYEREDGHYSEWEPPIVSTEAHLHRVGEHGLRAELTLRTRPPPRRQSSAAGDRTGRAFAGCCGSSSTTRAGGRRARSSRCTSVPSARASTRLERR